MSKFLGTIILLGGLFFALTATPLCGVESCGRVLSRVAQERVQEFLGTSSTFFRERLPALTPATAPTATSTDSASKGSVVPAKTIVQPKAPSLPKAVTLSTPKATENTPGALRVLEKIASGNSALTSLGIISDTNRERAKEGLAVLTQNNALRIAAEAKVDDMFARQYFEHISPTGQGPGDIAKNAGYVYVSVGENLALGNFKDDATVVAAWMASPGHRANIMNKNFREIGVAAKRGMFEGREVWLAVQEFGVPLSACPAISSTLSETIKTSKAQLAVTEDDLATRKQELSGLSPYDPMYNQKAEEYNVIVRGYNALLGKVRELIAEYNTQVNAFNTCAAGLVGH